MRNLEIVKIKFKDCVMNIYYKAIDVITDCSYILETLCKLDTNQDLRIINLKQLLKISLE